MQPTTLHPGLSELDSARARSDWATVQQIAQAILDAEPTPAARVLVALAQACWHLDEPAAADSAAARALAIDPALTEAVLVRVWVATARGDGEQALSGYARLIELNPGVARWSLQRIQLLNWLGYVAEAVNELEVAHRRWPDDAAIRTFVHNYGPAARFPQQPGAPEEKVLRTLVEQAPPAAQRLRPLLVNDPDRDVLTVETPHAKAAVLVFTGSNDSVAMPLEIFDHYLATLPLTVIYVKDFQRLRFLLGIRSLSPDYPGTVLALRHTLRRLGITHLSTLGNCDGGFAAVRYGVELAAARIIAFHAPTCPPDEASARFEQARNFKRTRLAAQVPLEMSDLKPFLKAHSQQPHMVELFYEEEDTRDRDQALRLAGLKGVQLRPYPGLSHHRLLRELALSHPSFSDWLGERLGVGAAHV
jgi:tetratricopeptide (TPR) repeat protein